MSSTPRRFTFSIEEVARSHARNPGPVYTHLELRTSAVDYALLFLNPPRIQYLRREKDADPLAKPLRELVVWEHSREPGRHALDRIQTDISTALYDKAPHIEQVYISWGVVLRPLGYDLNGCLIVSYDASEVDVPRVANALRLLHKYMRKCYGNDERFSEFVHWVFYFTDPVNLFESSKPVNYKSRDEATKRNHKAIHDFVLRLVRPNLLERVNQAGP